MNVRLITVALTMIAILQFARSAHAVVHVEYDVTVIAVMDGSGVFPGISPGDTGVGRFAYNPDLIPTQQTSIIAILIGLLQATQTIGGIETTAEGPFTMTLMRATVDSIEMRFEGIQGFDFDNERISYRLGAQPGSMLDASFELPDPQIFLQSGALSLAQVEVVLGDSRLSGRLSITAVVPEPGGLSLVLASLLALPPGRRVAGVRPLRLFKDEAMFRSSRHDWFQWNFCPRRGAAGKRRTAPYQQPHRRRLRIEPLEEKRLLALLTVTNLNDAGAGSLRDAIVEANATEAVDVIQFAPALTSAGPATIQLASQLTITRNLTINGPGANLLTIRAHAGTAATGDGSRIFNIDDGNLAVKSSVTLAGLTLAGGDVAGHGGAILLVEDLHVFDSIITGNHATLTGGAISHYRANIAITGSTISGNSAADRGGGIFHNQGQLTITRSTISGNSGFIGGGMSSYGAATIVESTFSGNSATHGGGVSHKPVGNLWIERSTFSGNMATDRGGGLLTETTLGIMSTTVLHSTFSNNSAGGVGGGILNDIGELVIRQSTITNNSAPMNTGGGVATRVSGSEVRVYSSVISANSGGGDVQYVNPVGPTNPYTSNGYNLVGTGNGISDFNATGDQTNVIEPRLGPLLDNGGPTRTHALAPNSPAFNAGDPSNDPNPFVFDQRGGPFLRVADGQMDIGAYERQTVAGLNLVVDTTVDESDGDYSAGDFSLREAIGLANGSLGPNTITFSPTLTGNGPATILLARGELSIGDALTINGPGAALLTIDASGNDPTPNSNNGDGSRVFNINDGSNVIQPVSISGLTLTGGDTSSYGGAIFNQELLMITGSVISHNFAHNAGGAIANGVNGSIIMHHSTIHANSTNDFGGAIVTVGTTVAVIQSTISGNAADRYGGGIASLHGNTSITRSTITLNTAPPFQGSGIAATQGTLGPTAVVVRSSIIAKNGSSDIDAIAPELGTSPGSFFSNGHNLIGFGNAVPNFTLSGDQTGVSDPLVNPLASNGGSTPTHALTPSSPAVNAGDPTIAFNPNEFDQRGTPYVRVHGGRIDIGAFEAQATVAPPALPGDYNQNGIVDAADYTVWRNSLGTTVPAPYQGADGNGDITIGIEDYQIWKNNYGEMQMEPGGAGLVGNSGQGSASGGQDSLTSAASLDDTLLDDAVQDTGASNGPLVAPETTTSLSRGPTVRRAREATLAVASRDEALVAWLVTRTANAKRLDLTEPLTMADDEAATDAALEWLAADFAAVKS